MGIQLAFDKTEEPDRFCNPELLCDNPRFTSWCIQDLGGWFRTVQHSAANWYGMDEADPCAWGTGRHDSYVSTFRLVIDKLLCIWTLTDLYSIESGGEKPMEKLLPESRTPGRSNRNSFVIPSQQQCMYNVIPIPHTGTCNMYMYVPTCALPL